MTEFDDQRPTRAEIDLGAIAHNLNLLRKKISPLTKVLVAVKSNAYGHGLIPVALFLQAQRVDFLGIATVGEGWALRHQGIHLPLLLLSGIFPEEIPQALNANLSFTIYDLIFAEILSKTAGKRRKRAKVHLKIDTGMGRLGFSPSSAVKLIEKISRLPCLEIEGLSTHFAEAEAQDLSFSRAQLEIFNGTIQSLRQKKILPPLIHCANSAALVNLPESHFNLIRPGLTVYGYSPAFDFVLNGELRPALALKSKIIFIKTVNVGESVSYGRTFVALKPTRVATLPVGYGDGYNRLLSNRGRVLIYGKYAPVIGRVCMDQTMVDVTNISQARVGSEAVLLGRQGQKSIRVEVVASLLNTIPYEVTCGIGERVRREYLPVREVPHHLKSR